jgi:hypothetical protein
MKSSLAFKQNFDFDSGDLGSDLNPETGNHGCGFPVFSVSPEIKNKYL